SPDRLRASCLFLAPATTESYTLSLHDALPISADVARVRVVAERGPEPGEEPLAHLRRVLPEALARHDLEVLHGDRAARRVARVGVRVHPAVLGLHRVHRVLDRLRDHDPAEREIARGDALGEREDVGLDVP